MSGVQRFVLRVLPRRWAASIEAESRAWLMICPCGHSLSVWDAGGIRWKAKGNPKRMALCPQCKQLTGHTLEFHPERAQK